MQSENLKSNFINNQKNIIMKSLKITHVIKALVLVVIMSFTVGNVAAQNHSVTVKINYLPVIVPNTPSTLPNIYNVCEYVPVDLQNIYVAHVDTNGVALASTDYTLVFDTLDNFSTPITTYTLKSDGPKTIYAKVTMNNSLACSNDTFSFVLNPRPEPVFTTQTVSTCYGVNADLTTAILSITDGGANPSIEFSRDSATFVSIADSANYDATVLGGTNGGDYKFYARIANTDAGSGCYSLIMPFILHIDTMPTLTLTAAASSNATEVCDGTTINLESFVSSVSPSTGTTLEFSIGDVNFTPALSGTAATNYLVSQNSTIQTSLNIFVRAKMNSTGCVSVNDSVRGFSLKVNPMPKLVLTTNTSSDTVCDATTINLEDHVTSYTSGATLQFSSNVNFTDTIEGAAATSYVLNLGNTTEQTRQFFVRAVMPGSNCVTVTDSIKNFILKIEPVPTIQTITAGGLGNACSNNIITYEVPSQVNVTYAWTVINSPTDGTIQGSGTGAKDSVLWAGANPAAQVQVVYTLTTNGKACSRTATENVTVLQSPTDVNLTIVSGNSETCDDGTNQIQLRVNVTDGAPNFIVDYSWSPDSGTGSVIVNTTAVTGTTFNVTLPNKGVDYTYTINKVTDANGCKLVLP